MSYIHQGKRYGGGVSANRNRVVDTTKPIPVKMCGRCKVVPRPLTTTGTMQSYCKACSSIRGKEYRRSIKL